MSDPSVEKSALAHIGPPLKPAQPGQPYFWMLIGAPASGKTTYRNRLIANSRVPKVVLSTDDKIEACRVAWSEADGRALSYAEAFDGVDMQCLEDEMREEMIAAVAARQDIMLDRTNLTFKSRARWLSLLTPDYYRFGVVCELPRTELDRRLAQREVMEGKSIPAQAIDDMLATYQRPVVGEFDSVLSGANLPPTKVSI